MEDKLDFYQIIQRAVIEGGWSGNQLARASGVSQASISRILRGEQINITLETQQKLLNALKSKEESDVWKHLDESGARLYPAMRLLIMAINQGENPGTIAMLARRIAETADNLGRAVENMEVEK